MILQNNQTYIFANAFGCNKLILNPCEDVRSIGTKAEVFVLVKKRREAAAGTAASKRSEWVSLRSGLTTSIQDEGNMDFNINRVFGAKPEN